MYYSSSVWHFSKSCTIFITGDGFKDITGSTIINESLIKDSFNKVQSEYRNEEAGKALIEIAGFIEKSGDPAAGALFDNFNQELNKPQSEKSKLKKFWEGIEKVLPSIGTAADAVSKITSLFH
jgi:hypothetical protein